MAVSSATAKGKAAAMPTVAVPEVVRAVRPNLADHVFKFCMKSSIVLGCCYFVLLSYIAVSNPQLEKLSLLPFFGVAVTVPLYAASLLKECTAFLSKQKSYQYAWFLGVLISESHTSLLKAQARILQVQSWQLKKCKDHRMVKPASLLFSYR